jgi:hypothetical protein
MALSRSANVLITAFSPTLALDQASYQPEPSKSCLSAALSNYLAGRKSEHS